MSQAEVVVCIHCGCELVRKPVKAAEPWPCYRWYALDGKRADRCPTCDTPTSNLDMFPKEDLAASGDRLTKFAAEIKELPLHLQWHVVHCMETLLKALPHDGAAAMPN